MIKSKMTWVAKDMGVIGQGKEKTRKETLKNNVKRKIELAQKKPLQVGCFNMCPDKRKNDNKALKEEL
jgi:hypothetical protein